MIKLAIISIIWVPEGHSECQPFDASFTMAALEYEQGVSEYIACLSGVESDFGFNHGPLAVAACRPTKQSVLQTYSDDRRDSIVYLLNQIDREKVLLDWCEYKTGKSLPIGIEVREEWPQFEEATEVSE